MLLLLSVKLSSNCVYWYMCPLVPWLCCNKNIVVFINQNSTPKAYRSASIMAFIHSGSVTSDPEHCKQFINVKPSHILTLFLLFLLYIAVSYCQRNTTNISWYAPVMLIEYHFQHVLLFQHYMARATYIQTRTYYLIYNHVLINSWPLAITNTPIFHIFMWQT